MFRKKALVVYSFILLLISACTKDQIVSVLGGGENEKAVGASANDLLAASKYSGLAIEIQYMPGYAPDASAVNNMVSFLNTYINKSGGIQVTQTQIAASGKSALNINDLISIEKTNRTTFTAGNKIAVYVLIGDAAWANPGVLGVAYKNTSICLFGKTIQDNSGAVGQVNRTKLVTTVVEHEFGHLLGLVDLGSSMVTNHKDAANGNHCSNTNCLMYYAAQVNLMSGIISSVPPLDADCRNDLKANSGK